jgi:hypothetical protein
MPTYNAKLDVNICAPDRDDAFRQLPGYVKNHLTLTDRADIVDVGTKKIYLLEKRGDSGGWGWDNIFDAEKDYTPEMILKEAIEEDNCEEDTVDVSLITKTGNRWKHPDHDTYGVWLVTC